MIACFDNLVGIRTECGEQVASDSGLYIQDLPYINIKTANAVIQNQDDWEEVLQDKIDIAGNYLINDVKSKLAPVFLQKSVIQNQIAGYYQDNKTTSSGIAGTLKGIQLRVWEYPYLDLFISSISIFTDRTGVIPILVYDLIQGKLLDTINITGVAGEIVQVDVNKTYRTNGQAMNLFFGYDSTGINNYTTYLYTQGIAGCRTCPRPNSWGNKYVWMYAKSLPTSAIKVQNSLQSINDTGGLSLVFSLQCSVDKFICQMKNSFAFALMHRAGMEILREVKMSTRMNNIVMLKKDEVDELMGYFETTYNQSMDNILKNLRLPKDICFNCNSVVRTGVIGS